MALVSIFVACAYDYEVIANHGSPLGWFGLTAAKAYLQLHPDDKITALESAESCGGTWSKNRLYLGLKSNNIIGSYEIQISQCPKQNTVSTFPAYPTRSAPPISHRLCSTLSRFRKNPIPYACRGRRAESRRWLETVGIFAQRFTRTDCGETDTRYWLDVYPQHAEIRWPRRIRCAILPCQGLLCASPQCEGCEKCRGSRRG